MLNESKVIAFAATRNSLKARKFYQESLGLDFISDEPFALVFNCNGVMLRIAKVQELAPAPYTVLGWEVSDIRAKIADLKRNGVVFERFEGMPQDELGIWSAPSGAKVAWFKDPDGNVLSLSQMVTMK